MILSPQVPLDLRQPSDRGYLEINNYHSILGNRVGTFRLPATLRFTLTRGTRPSTYWLHMFLHL